VAKKSWRQVHLEKSKDAIERTIEALRADMRRLKKQRAVGPLKDKQAEFDQVREQYNDVIREIQQMKSRGEWVQ
jgi:hypothetical protein